MAHQVFSKKVKYHFSSASDLEAAKKTLDTNYPRLRTTHCESVTGFTLFVESTLSFIYDSLVESLMKKHGGTKMLE